MPPKTTEFTIRLKAAREKAGFTQDQAAESWKLSVKTLRAWEQGWNEPRGLYRTRIERILRKIESQ